MVLIMESKVLNSYQFPVRFSSSFVFCCSWSLLIYGTTPPTGSCWWFGLIEVQCERKNWSKWRQEYCCYVVVFRVLRMRTAKYYTEHVFPVSRRCPPGRSLTLRPTVSPCPGPTARGPRWWAAPLQRPLPAISSTVPLRSGPCRPTLSPWGFLPSPWHPRPRATAAPRLPPRVSGPTPEPELFNQSSIVSSSSTIGKKRRKKINDSASQSFVHILYI